MTLSAGAGVAPKCKRCFSELPLGAPVCSHCHSLVHAEELSRIAEQAKALELATDYRSASEAWRKALPLLPQDSRQAEWIQTKLEELLQASSVSDKQALGANDPKRSRWINKLGPLGPILILLAKGKSLLALFKLSSLLTLFAFLGVYWSMYGMQFGIGFTAIILVHELGHYVDIKRRGLPAEMPVFLPGLGAYVRWNALGVSDDTKARVSLAGPIAGLLAAGLCVAVWRTTGNPFWAALARAGAWLNILNLIPIWALDGTQALAPLNKAARIAIATVSLGLWHFAGEGLFLLVAAGVVYRLFTKEEAQEAHWATALLFMATLTLLGVAMWLTPGHGFGNF